MIQHRRFGQRIPMHALAILVTALVACGTVNGAGSAGRPATTGSEIPSDVRLTEYEYEGQRSAPRPATTGETVVEGRSDAPDGPVLIP